MSSERKKESSKRNGARSKGPVTPEGKRRSSLNAMRHGLLAECTVLESESREDFNVLVNMFLERFDPVDGVDFGFIEEMASSYWRLRRGMMMEKTLLDKAVAEQTWDKLADSSEFKSICRYQTMLHRMFQRAMNNILLLRDIGPEDNVFPNEPSPKIEHSEPDPSPNPPEPHADPARNISATPTPDTETQQIRELAPQNAPTVTIETEQLRKGACNPSLPLVDWQQSPIGDRQPAVAACQSCGRVIESV